MIGKNFKKIFKWMHPKKMLVLLLFFVGLSFSLDKDQISKWYFDGDFDKVRDALESYRKSSEAMTREDSVFLYKHLSVVYAAKEDTREKAESYMYQLLKIVPTIDLIDMYISDNIESIFNTVKDRYARLNQSSPSAENSQSQISGSENKPMAGKNSNAGASPNNGKKDKKWIWWTAGGTGIVALVALFVITSSEDSPSSSQNFELNL